MAGGGGGGTPHIPDKYILKWYTIIMRVPNKKCYQL